MNKANYEYLCLIQNVVTRMANNAFLIKGWSITLTAALLSLGASLSNNPDFDSRVLLGITLVVIFVFFWLDGYFYYNEKKYRELYDYARDTDRFEAKHLYDLNPNILVSEEDDKDLKVRWKVMTHKAVYPVYLVQFIIVCMAILFFF